LPTELHILCPHRWAADSGARLPVPKSSRGRTPSPKRALAEALGPPRPLCEGGTPPVCVLRCRRRCAFWLKPLPHSAQWKGRSPRFPHSAQAESLLLKRLGHSRQVKGCLPEWVFWWAMRLGFWAKRLPHWVAFSLAAWMRWWASRLAFWLKLLPHCVQGKGRSPVCTRRWVSRLGRWLKLLPQSPQR
uniref:Uncharacterized protein n=1 Tax=Anas platyrhynchos platyrhynchos TaxID=8840 RepID=A0A493TP74_ANAPP